jgi:glycosyltransferase involved in cell wall biosynthesis
VATDTVDVVVFVNDTSETSISLEIASYIVDETISQTICSFFSPDSPAFGLDVVSLDARSQFDVRAYRRLYALLREEQPDVLHVHPNATGSLARVLGRLVGIPHIVSTEHSTHDDFSRLKNLINGSTNWTNDVVICNSETTAASLRRWENLLLRWSNTDKTVVYNGVNLDSVRHEQTGDWSGNLPDGFLIGTAARLVPEKNLAALIPAARRVIAAHADVHLVIVGDGPERHSLETLTREHGIGDHVHFVGYLSRKAVHAVMKNLDIYAFPSHYEGFGVAVAEAMAARCPVVVNDIPVLHEIVGDAGIYVDANDTAAFAAALETLYCDDKEQQRLGRLASERVDRKFSIKNTAENYAETYRQLTQNG